MTSPTAIPGTLHRYTPHLVAFTHAPPPHQPPSPPPKNHLLLIGGLYDTLLTIPYTPALHASLPPTWTLVSPLLSSSGTGFGTSSLDNDIRDLARCVKYFRARQPPGGKIVLMGHSTGAQDVLHYLSSPGYGSSSSSSSSSPSSSSDDEEGGGGRAKIDGAILQGAVSDRQALALALSLSPYPSATDHDRLTALAKTYVRDGRADDVLPLALTSDPFPGVPLSATRWLSLASPGPEHVGADDMFSSDLPDARLRATFGRAGGTAVPVLVLYGGADEYVPGFVDREGLVGRWVRVLREGGGVVDAGSGVVEGVGHTMAEEGEGREECLRRVGAFLGRVEGGGF